MLYLKFGESVSDIRTLRYYCGYLDSETSEDPLLQYAINCR